MSDGDFLAGKLRFDGANGVSVRNEGTIRASGDIYLVGPIVENAAHDPQRRRQRRARSG